MPIETTGGVPALVPLSEAIKVTQLDSHTYSANLSASFTVGSVPNGGYTASTLLAAARAHLTSATYPQPDPITAHFTYLDRTEAGPAIIVISDTKLGRTTSVLNLTLYQSQLLPHAPWITPRSRKCLTAYTTSSNIANEKGPTLPTTFILRPPPPPPRQGPSDEKWVPGRQIASRVKHHNASKQLETCEPASQVEAYHQRSVMEYWMRPIGGGTNRWTDASLAFAADAKAHMVENYQRPKTVDADEQGWLPKSAGFMWYPTLVMNLDIKKKLPEEGVEWLYLRCEMKRIVGGRLDMEVVILDEAGDVVVIANHVNLILSGTRNLKGREGTGSKI